jgi:ornithine cyclodeaminase/alanine dehydrogenase-like protein (mu-crystallin family)
MPLYLSEEEVGRLLPMPDCIEAVEQAFRQWGEGRASNRPRARATLQGGLLHTLSAASDDWGRMAAKVYATTRAGARFVVLLFDGKTSDLIAIIEADRLGQIRTGAASGVATRHLAKPGADTLAVIGTGWQARGQAVAIAAVRKLRAIRAFGRDRDRLAAFCREVEEATGVTAIAAASAEAAVRGADIVATATSAAGPILQGGWIDPGTHINAVGSNRIDRRELDSAVIDRAAILVVDAIDQARLEAGDLVGAGTDGAAAAGGGAGPPAGTGPGPAARPGPPLMPALERAVELAAIVAGRVPGRRRSDDITLFKSLGIGLEDLAAAQVVYDRAVAENAGRVIP